MKTLDLAHAIAAVFEFVETHPLNPIDPLLLRLQEDVGAMEQEIQRREDELVVLPILEKWLGRNRRHEGTTL